MKYGIPDLYSSEQLSLSARRVWIEMYHLSIHLTTTTSLSARRVWIEI